MRPVRKSILAVRRSLVIIAAVSAVLYGVACKKQASAPAVSVSAPPVSVSPPPADAPAGGLRITVPVEGTKVAPGTSVHVVVEPPPGITRVLVVGPETTAVDEAAPFELDLLIPAKAMGRFA